MRVRALLVASLLLAGTSALQARSLYWSAVDVDAKIDRDGSLTVEETQHYVFDGEWNGGERTFDIRYLQSLDLLGVDRIEGSSVIPLAKGDLASVDHYQMMSGNVLRWRSRLPTDPAFDKTPLVTRD